MLLKEWELWHTYATYLIDPIKNLDDAAKNLVQCGLLECAYVSNGKFYWLKNSILAAGKADVILDTNRASALYHITPSPPDSYAGEALFQSMYLRFAELKQYRQFDDFPPSYVRGHLGLCQLTSAGNIYHLYPIIKIFDSGVLLVEFRIFSPEAILNVKEFVEEFLNLYKRNFDDVLDPPILRVAGQHAYALVEKPVDPMMARIGSYLLDRDLRRYIQKNKSIQRYGDFDFELVHLWGEYKDKREAAKMNETDAVPSGFSLSHLANVIFDAISVSIHGLRKGKSLLVKPNYPLVLGNSWTGRSHVHLLKFRGQGKTVKENETKFQNDYGWILMGEYRKDSDLGKRHLPPNARYFDDYGAYIAERGTLWAWTTRGVSEAKKWEIANHGHLVYFNQSQCELLEYGYMLHRRMLEVTANPQRIGASLRDREKLIKLEIAMNDVSGYGELRDLLHQGWNDMHVNRLQEAVSDMIAIKQTEASMQEERSITALQIVISIAFGVATAADFGAGFVQPLWDLLKLWRPSDSNAQKIWFFTIALMCILLFIWFLTNWAKKKLFRNFTAPENSA